MVAKEKEILVQTLSVICMSDWWSRDHGSNPRWVWQHSFMETEHEHIVILSLLLVQVDSYQFLAKEWVQVLVNFLEEMCG